MSKIVLWDWNGGMSGWKRHILNQDTGEIRQIITRDKQHCLGFGMFRKIGLWKRVKVFIAIYTDGKSLIFRMGNQLIDVSNQEITANRKRVAPFIRRFEIRNRNQVIVSIIYYQLIGVEEPTSWDAEFLTYVEDKINDKAKIPHTIKAWSNVNRGKDD